MDGIEIRYAGVLLGRATQVREQGPDGLFVGFAEPLPVGTPVALKSSDGEQSGRVSEVIESADPSVAGMRVQRGAGAVKPAPQPASAAPAASAAPPASAAPAASAEASAAPAATTAPPAAAATAPATEGHHAEGEPHAGPNDGDHGGRRKKRRR